MKLKYLLMLIFWFFLLGFPVVFAPCGETGFFKPNQQYDKNRALLFSSLPSNVSARGGFYNASIGQGRNRVYAVGMCIQGAEPKVCSNCIDLASKELIENCPNQTKGLVWPENGILCMIRYSNRSFFGSLEMQPKFILYNVDDIRSNITMFDGFWENTTSHMIATATSQLSVCKYYEAEAAFNLTLAPPPKPPTSITPSRGNRANTTKRGSDSISAGIIVAIVVPTVIIFLLLLALAFLIWRRRKSDKAFARQGSSIGITETTALQFDFKTVEAATDQFSEKNVIGRGGFGEVFKGVLNETEVAIKRLSKASGQGATEFKNEAVLVAKLQHRNLERLLGFCVEGEEKILEFVPNKSLDYFLFDPSKHIKMDWTTRYKIIEGIARGVLYLHQDSRLTIIHRDLKASNILLGADMNLKIADFGMARIMCLDQTQCDTSRIVGTYGYMAPEYAMNGHFSMKSDVHSFGVIVLEIISGKRNSSFCRPDGSFSSLVAYAWEPWRNGSPLEIFDPAIEGSYQRNEVIRCIHIALLCVQKDHAGRPEMSTVILMLTSNTITLPVPGEPGFFFKSGKNPDSSFTWSVDDASITHLEPR